LTSNQAGNFVLGSRVQRTQFGKKRELSDSAKGSDVLGSGEENVCAWLSRSALDAVKAVEKKKQ